MDLTHPPVGLFLPLHNRLSMAFFKNTQPEQETNLSGHIYNSKIEN